MVISFVNIIAGNRPSLHILLNEDKNKKFLKTNLILYNYVIFFQILNQDVDDIEVLKLMISVYDYYVTKLSF